MTRSATGTGLARASECAIDYPSSCFTPAQLRDAYFPDEAPETPADEPQTIALVDAYNDPSAEADLATYSSEFELPSCTSANGCFKQVGQSGGEVPFPKTKAELETFAKGTAAQRLQAEEAEGWSLEIATDIEMAHAICRNCHVLLVAAKSPSYSDLEAAEETAAAQANEVSNSWGGEETGLDSKAFNHEGVVITASAGDNGYLNWDQYATREEPTSTYFQGTDYPATSPHVIAVGGTRLQLSAGGAWQSESPWSSEGAGGSGCSEWLPAPQWQQNVNDWAQVGCGSMRASADVSAVADPTTGVNVYDSIPYPYEEAGHKLTTVLHWVPIGGTSVASPIVASMFALAGGAHGVPYPAQTLYSHLGSSLLHDMQSGGNGECQGEYISCSGSLDLSSVRFPLDCGVGAWICNATAGYDGPTGVGTPNGLGAFRVIEGPGEKGSEPGKESEPEGKPEEEVVKGEEPPNEGGSTESPGEPETPAGSKSSGGSETPGSKNPSGSSETGSVTGNAASSSGDSEAAKLRPSGNGVSPRVTRLALTAHGSAALRRHRRAKGIVMSRLAFSFALTSAAKVQATLFLRVGSGTRARWVALSPTLGFSASAGVHRRELHGSRLLAPGIYRLTLTPLGGVSCAIIVRVP